ncbi:cerebellin-1-like [Eucyclogobius newberryi]|uniref:cerebellin-1-like n=1 Tax=Eucyclogobius newberryi TaxID=166745 RepID=UPI003B5CD104
MKAFVVLCVLLGSSLVKAQSSTCTSGVCGCCLINTQLQRMNHFFNMSHEHMSEELTVAKQALNNLRASRTSFSAVLSDVSQNCNSQVPSATPALVRYHVVNVNLGNNYDAAQGKFIAPRKGVYSFAITLYNLGPYKSCASLMLNGNAKYTLMEKVTADTQDSASVSLTLSLEAGDVVHVEQPAGCVMCAQDNLYNTFTGYLLYAKD